jgi:hypothetical protein
VQVQLVTVESLLDRIDRASYEEFIAEYPGVFLLAMGFVSGEIVTRQRGNDTLAINFGDRLRHDPSQEHPLAGCAFFIRAGGESDKVTIGRSPQCNLTVPDPSVSELHCCVMITDEGVAAMDLDSRNGTSINMQRLASGTPSLLGDEDILTLGRYSFQVMTAGTLHSALELLRAMEES